MAAEPSSAWSKVNALDSTISLIKPWIPGAVMTALTAYGTLLWARFTHLHGVEQFVLVLVVVTCCLGLWAIGVVLWPRLTPKIDVSLRAYVTPSSEVIVTVTNHGSEGIFSGRAVVKFLKQDQPPFQLAWQDSTARDKTIGKDDSSSLILATMQDEEVYVSYRMTIWQLLSNARESFCLSLWNINPQEKLPNQLIQVIVNCSSKRGTASSYFLVSPAAYTGPLQVLKFSKEDEEAFV